MLAHFFPQRLWAIRFVNCIERIEEKQMHLFPTFVPNRQLGAMDKVHGSSRETIRNQSHDVLFLVCISRRMSLFALHRKALLNEATPIKKNHRRNFAYSLFLQSCTCFLFITFTWNKWWGTMNINDKRHAPTSFENQIHGFSLLPHLLLESYIINSN